MMDMATNPVVYLRKPMQSINRQILNIPQMPFVIPQELQASLESAAEAFEAKSYKLSAKYLKDALDSMSYIDVKSQPETIVLTKYMLCMCWLESTDAKDLLDALKILEELENNYGYAYPMLYYAIGKAYYKLYRFNKADEMLIKGFSILNSDTEVVEYKIPGSDIFIPESSRDRLVAALTSLNNQCSSWHRLDAVCCMPDCSSHSQNESADKNIYFGSPTFIGMVQVSCNNTSNTCTMSFHIACWKAKKENLCSLSKLSDKDLLHWECFTPNCEDRGVRCTIKKIEIFDENAKVKSSMTCADEVVRHTKIPSQPAKGAIRKQQRQQTPKVKPPVERHPRPPVVPHEVHKTDEADDDDDLDDEQALRLGVEQLIELRASNFGIDDEKMWRPNLSLYGNEFMLATADAQPDPDFRNEGPEDAELKAFFFSYFYTFILKSGPVKVDVLTTKWHEAKNMMDKDCDSIFKHYIDIADFLLQSVKFAMVGGYICVAEKLPEAYDFAKSDACDTLKFFMDNDIDQRSDSSSVDDEAFYNDIVNPEKNNSLAYSSISEDSKSGIDDVNMLSKFGQYLQYATPSRPQPFKHKFREFGTTTAVDDHTMGPATFPVKLVAPHENVEKKKPNIPSQPELPVEKISTPVKKSAPKRPDMVEHLNGEVSDCIEKNMPIGTKESRKNDESLRKAMNGVDHVHEIASQMNAASKPKVPTDKFTKESGKPDERPNQTISPPHISENETINPVDGPTRSEAANNEKEFLVEELIEEVQRLSSKLRVAEDRAVQLESEIAQIKKAHAAEKVRLFQKLLQGQYAYNHSSMIRKLDECHKNYELILLIQKILMKSIDCSLPVNVNKYQTVIADIEKILRNHENKFWEMNNKLVTATDPESITEVDLQTDVMPNMPAIDVLNAIQQAFGMYENYVTNKILQSAPLIQYAPRQNPHAFNFPPLRPYHPQSEGWYGHIMGMMYPPNDLPNGPPPPNVRMPQSSFATPNNQQSQQSPTNSAHELRKINPSTQQEQQKFVEPGSTGNKSGNAQTSEASDVQALVLQRDTANDNSGAKSTPAPVSSAVTDNSQKQLDVPVAPKITSRDRYAKPKETKPRKKNYHSIDKLVQILRSRYVGVLELDLIKSVETVRRNHRNSLSGMPMGKIIHKVGEVIMERQQKQLCGYEKRQSQFSSTTNTSALFLTDGEHKRENWTSSTSSVNSATKYHRSIASKKTWEPVVIPNGTWKKETPESDCVICFETMLHNGESCTLQCYHTFHKKCIKNWYKECQSCPTCRVHSMIDDEYPPLPSG